MRVALSGTFSTGKTTLADACAPRLTASFGRGFTYIREVARTVIKSGFALDRAATTDAYNLYIQLQLSAERTAAAGPQVLSDRSLIDLFAYVRYNDEALVPEYVVKMLEEIVWLESRYFDVFCYLPVEFPMVHDGVRTPDESYRVAIDTTLQSMLRDYGVRVETVTGSVEERVRRVLATFGVTP